MQLGTIRHPTIKKSSIRFERHCSTLTHHNSINSDQVNILITLYQDMEDPKAHLKSLLVRSRTEKVDLRTLPFIKSNLNIKVVDSKFVVIVTGVLLLTVSVYVKMYLSNGDCALELPSEFSKMFRSPENCNFCANVTEVDRIANISPDEFEQKYAYNGRPVIVTDATSSWTALETFDFWYFKEIYEEARKRTNKPMNCQFFPYKTEFKSFYEAMNIPKERVNYEPGTEPWYFGWSNCNEDVAQILRQHYGRPYFLPKTSENNAIDWIFMGGAGLGAHMHVRFVFGCY